MLLLDEGYSPSPLNLYFLFSLGGWELIFDTYYKKCFNGLKSTEAERLWNSSPCNWKQQLYWRLFVARREAVRHT